MNNESISKLRVDRRLHGRRGWIDEAELQREIDALPDVSDKMRTPDDELERPAESVGSPAPEAAAPVSDPAVGPEGGGV